MSAVVAFVSRASAVATLGANGFRTTVLEGGTICAYINGHAYGFAPRPNGYSLQSILAAVRIEAPPLLTPKPEE